MYNNMAGWIHLSVCIITAFVFSSVSCTTLNLPNTINIGGANPTEYLNGTCRPPRPTGGQIMSVFSIVVGRYVGESQRPMGRVYLNTDSGQVVREVVDSSLQSRLTVTGTTSPAAQAEIQFSLRDPTCSDATMYYCNSQFIPDSAGSRETTQNVTTNVFPGDFKMVATPNYTFYNPPTPIEFTCTAQLGNSNQDQANFWVWRWRYKPDDNFGTPSSWYTITENITYRRPSPDGCNYRGGSTYITTITEADNNKQIQCYIVDPNMYSASKNIFTETPIVPTTESADVTSTDDVQTTESADVSSGSSSSSRTDALSACFSPIILLGVCVSALLLSLTQPW